jgi:undecaprenyl diphosphate synthase
MASSSMTKRSRNCPNKIKKIIRCTFFIGSFLAFLLLEHSSCHAYPLSTYRNGQKSSPRIQTVPKFSSSVHHTNGDDSGPGFTSEGPRHIALICDGNSRWAKARNLPSVAGHAAGARRLIELVGALKRKGVDYCTVYVFSTENWRRPESEVRDILSVMEETARLFYGQALRDDVRVKVLGDLNDERIPSGLREILERLERESGGIGSPPDDNNKLTLSIAINYGGRQDILNASKRLALALAEDDSFDLDAITEERFASFLGTANTPDPDLVIRTSRYVFSLSLSLFWSFSLSLSLTCLETISLTSHSFNFSECRVSNFLLWNIAYAELYFADTLWPDFDETSLDDALDWYKQRERRFGARKATERGSRL